MAERISQRAVRVLNGTTDASKLTAGVDKVDTQLSKAILAAENRVHRISMGSAIQLEERTCLRACTRCDQYPTAHGHQTGCGGLLTLAFVMFMVVQSGLTLQNLGTEEVQSVTISTPMGSLENELSILPRMRV